MDMTQNNMLTDLPNIGQILAIKLRMVGICSAEELIQTGSEEAIIRLQTLKNGEACINMLYALEGAVQGIRWHNLDNVKKLQLLEFYQHISQ